MGKNGALHLLFTDLKKAHNSGEKYCTTFSPNLV